MGFVKSAYDSCVYIRTDGARAVTYLVLYVDDMLVAAASMEEINAIKEELKKEFEMKDLGEAKMILGMDILRIRDEGRIWLMQEDYLGKIVKRFQMENSKQVSVPLAQHFKLCLDQVPKTDSQRSEMQQIPYSNIVGSIMYSMICTRPDLAHAISVTSRYMKEYGENTGWL